MFVIRRNDGAFVARPGSKKSYTKSLLSARTFATREAALADKCGNESVYDLAELI